MRATVFYGDTSALVSEFDMDERVLSLGDVCVIAQVDGEFLDPEFADDEEEAEKLAEEMARDFREAGSYDSVQVRAL